VSECPEIKDLARLVETGEAEPGVREHLASCDACTEAVETFEDEVASLQISISEIWYRERISCLDDATLKTYGQGGLDADLRRYVEFHLTELDCERCQGVVGSVEASRTEEGKRRVTRSRSRAEDASVKLLGDLRRR
jgi:hypothetical protein